MHISYEQLGFVFAPVCVGEWGWGGILILRFDACCASTWAGAPGPPKLFRLQFHILFPFYFSMCFIFVFNFFMFYFLSSTFLLFLLLFLMFCVENFSLNFLLRIFC